MESGLKFSKTAETIVRRLAESVVRVQYSRADLCCFEDAPTEDEMVDDAIAVSMGEEQGCLDEDEMTAENVDVLFVEKQLQEFLAQYALAPELHGEAE